MKLLEEHPGLCMTAFAAAVVTVFMFHNEMQKEGKIIIDLPRDRLERPWHTIVIDPDKETLTDIYTSGFIGGKRIIDFQDDSLTGCIWAYQRGVGFNRCEELSFDGGSEYIKEMTKVFNTFVPKI